MDENFEVVTQLGHDLNKYLARIKAYNYLLLNRFEKTLNEEERSFFDGIDQECDSMFRFISDLVTADKVSTQGEIDNFEIVPLYDFIHQLSQRYQTSARLKNITLRVEENAPFIFVKVHTNTFERAINNLLHNALKFTPKNGKVYLDWSICPCQRFVDIQVSDTGIGIPDQLQPHVFNKFTKAGRKGIEGEESNGLGLYITKNIVEKHGGTIWFETEEYKGTTFTIKLPMIKNSLKA